MTTKTKTDETDRGWMAVALALGRRALGTTAPNPAVGCAIVKDGVAVGRGVTGAGGRPHAEFFALKAAGEKARGATAYVSLEPCATPGRGPACADELIAAGVARVVFAIADPHPAVNGAGAAKLRDAGVEVVFGLLDEMAARDQAGFFLTVLRKRPLFALKLATSLDGRIAAAGGASQWITGPAARAAAHALRARYDAVLIGAGTLRADDPALNVRLPGHAAASPWRVVVAGRHPVPVERQVFVGDIAPTLLILPADAAAPSGLAGHVAVERVAADSQGRPAIAALAAALEARGLTRVLIEGGAGVAAAFWRAGLVDRLVWMRAPLALGGDGVPALTGLDVTEPSAAGVWRAVDRRAAGPDTIEHYERAERSSGAAVV